ncbi:MAG: MFS transporter [Tenericutes bacterium]|nr:MFS transporter [Mycoplasmatota bacterium]
MKTRIKTSNINLLLFSGNETATTASFNLIAVFFTLMMTDNLLLSGVVAGFIFMFSRIFDAITDPLIGTLIDKTTTRFGRYRPFIIIGSFTLNLGILAIFGGFVKFDSNILMYGWIMFWYVVYIIGYTFQSACTRSGQTIITNDQYQRPLLGSLLAGFSYLFYGVFLITSISYVKSFDGGFANSIGYRNLAIMIVALNMFLTTLSVISLRKADTPSNYEKLEKKSKKVTISAILDLIKNNKPLRRLIVAAGTNKLAQLITATSMAYFFIYTVGDINVQKTVASWGLGFGILGVVVGTVIAQRFDRKKSFLIGTYLGLFFPIVIIITHPFSANLQWLLVGCLVAILFATALASANVLPMIADVADYEFHINKHYVPSIVGTTFSLVDKLMSSLSGLILAGALYYISYYPNMPESPKAFWAFFVMVIIIPALGHVASILAFRAYPINKEFYDKMTSSDN